MKLTIHFSTVLFVSMGACALERPSTFGVSPSQSAGTAPTPIPIPVHMRNVSLEHDSLEIALRGASQMRVDQTLLLDVTFANPSRTDRVLDDPVQSVHTEVHMVDQLTHEDHGFTMSRVTTRLLESGEFALETPSQTLVTLSAEGTRNFRFDASVRLFLQPGVYDVYITYKDRSSNHLTIRVDLTRASLGHLFAMARAPQVDYTRREWATYLLARVYPGFKLSLALPNDDLAVRNQREAANEPVYAAFTKWLVEELKKPD
jgi:hypothetical protein